MFFVFLESVDLSAYHDLGPLHIDCRINTANAVHNKKTYITVLSETYCFFPLEPTITFRQTSPKKISCLKPNSFSPSSPRSPPHPPILDA
jgi:hypothetical protein